SLSSSGRRNEGASPRKARRQARPQARPRPGPRQARGEGLTRYRVVRLLGAGGMASVRLAHDAELGRPVALKVLHAGLAGDGAFRRRFLREARLAARVSHPNVVQVFDAGVAEDGTPYIVMEYVDGE